MDTQGVGFKYGAFTKNRVEAFSDGVFAIIVTLLILEIRIPHVSDPASPGALFEAIVSLAPKFVSWVISFLTVCIVWMNHHRLFDMFKGINMALFWLNVHALLWICFVPFPTGLMGDYPGNPLAVAFYGAVMACTGAALVITRLYGLKNKILLKDEFIVEHYKKALFSAAVGTISYLFAAALAFVSPALAFAMYFLIAVFFVFSTAVKKSG